MTLFLRLLVFGFVLTGAVIVTRPQPQPPINTRTLRQINANTRCQRGRHYE